MPTRADTMTTLLLAWSVLGYPSGAAPRMVEIYYLEAPLLSYEPPAVRELMIAAQGYHAGLALRRAVNGSRHGDMTTWEYDATNGLFAGILPTIDNGQLSWKNAGVVRRIGFNASYWQRASLLATVPDDDPALDAFAGWVTAFNSTAPDYNGFEVVDAASGETLLRSSTCSDFAGMDAIRALKRLGVRVAPLVATRKSRALFYSAAAPVRVPPSDTELLRYWGSIAQLVHATTANGTSALRTLEAVAVITANVARKHKVAFVRSGGADYRVELAPPFARFSYDMAPQLEDGAEARRSQ